jgi:hypothetical protein
VILPIPRVSVLGSPRIKLGREGGRIFPVGIAGRMEDVSLQVALEEPEARPWRVELLIAVIDAVIPGGRAKIVAGRPVVLAVDGRSNSGKTTLAARIARAVPGAVVVHTDDIAWEHSRFGWADLLTTGILVPIRQGRAVSYRPPRWVEHGRAGSIDIPVDCPLLLIEGDGAGRREVTHLIDALIWVQSDQREAERRRLARERNPDAADTANRALDRLPVDHEGWMAEELPFNAAHRAWERADIIVCGTPEIPCDPVTEIVVGPAPAPASARS